MLAESRRTSRGASLPTAAVTARACLAALVLAAVACLAPAGSARAQAAPAAVADSNDFAPTSAVPWNPERPIPASLPWETALRLPGRVATLPLSALGQLSRRTLLVVEEKSLVPRVLMLFMVLPRAGLGVTPASLGDRTGFGARVVLAPPQLGRHVEVEYSGSTRDYNRTRAALVAGFARLEFGHDWRPEERFHGLGMGASLDDTTNYSSSVESVTLALAHRWTLGAAGRALRVGVRAWGGGRGITVGRGREDEIASIETRYPGPGGSPFFVGGSQWIGGAGLTLDTRAGRPHWSRGERLSLAFEASSDRDDASLLLHETSGVKPSDHVRFTAEFETGVSFWRDPRTLRLLVRTDRLDPLDDGRSPALPDLPALGGSDGLGGFEPARFHDLASVLARVSYLFPLAQNFELDAHVEAGGVFPAISAARAGELETSYGLLLRPRTRFAPLGAVGVQWSRESVRIRYTIGGVE